MQDKLRRHPFLALGFVLALALTIFFALRIAMGALIWSPSATGPLEGWMTVGYVAQVRDVPRTVLAQAIGIAPGSHPRQSLQRLAQERGESLDALIARLEAASAQYHGDVDD
ncbi:MAG: hypothetical protein ACO22Z_13670 [Paracoccaceae bacterium]